MKAVVWHGVGDDRRDDGWLKTVLELDTASA